MSTHELPHPPAALPPGHFLLDGQEVAFAPGQSVIEAAAQAGHVIPHLCWHADFAAHASCRLCSVSVNGRTVAACTYPASAGLEVLSQTDALRSQRKTLLQEPLINSGLNLA
jgi:[NiFe] hydrogenase diaphorase moiety small subunit